MVRIGILPATLALAAFSAPCFFAVAQTPLARTSTATEQAPKVTRVSPNQDYLPMPPANRSLAIDVRPMDKMSDGDRQLEASSESAIARRAALWGMDLNSGGWTYEQLSCPAFPDHVFLRFTRNGGSGDISIFTASIPRQGGEVRMVPLVLRGYSLYTPGPVNPLTTSTFNHIGAEEKLAKTADWLAVGLCYASLAGSNAQIDFPDAADAQPTNTFPAWTSVVTMTMDGGKIVEFTDIGARPNPMQWTLTFDAGLRLVKAVKEAVATIKVLDLHDEPAEPQGTPTSSKVTSEPDVPVIRANDSSEPNGPVIHTPNNDSLPAPKDSQSTPKDSSPAPQQ